MKKRKSDNKHETDPLIGTWDLSHTVFSSIEIIIGGKSPNYFVKARDTYDGEIPDVYEVAKVGDVLSFAFHWNSTGRFTRYRVQLLTEDQLGATFTHTDQEVFQRKRKNLSK
jgi:hypothetical protein